MIKFGKVIFLLFLVCFSFFYTDKVIDMINKNDPLMEEIVSKKSDYNVLPVDALIDDDTVIPGIIGMEIDVDRSYDNMKIGGIFREEELVFRSLLPNNSISDNIDKYIIMGNNKKKEVSLIYIYNNKYIEKIKYIDNITLFINHKDLDMNVIDDLKDKEIYTYGNNGEYSGEILVSDNSLIGRLSNNKSKYCLSKNKNDSLLEMCNKYNMNVVIPNIVGGYYNVKNELVNGSIILLNNLNDIDVIIKYIRSKGYNIVGLNKLLSE